MPDLTKAFSWRLWLRGLLGAFMGGGTNAIILMQIDPANYNVFDHGSIKKLLSFTACSAIVSAALYIKTHPIAPESSV